MPFTCPPDNDSAAHDNTHTTTSCSSMTRHIPPVSSLVSATHGRARLLQLSKQAGKASPWLIGVVLSVAAGAGWWAAHRGQSAADSPDQPASSASGAQAGKSGARRFGGADRPQPISVGSVRRQDVRVIVSAIGSIAAANTAVVKPKVDGELKALYFVEGQTVKAGAVLAEIDPRPFQIALDQAQGQLARDQAQLKNALLDLDRFRDLLTKDGFLKALRAVKEQKLQYNGQPVTPYALLFSDKGAEHVAQQLGASYEDKDGNYQSIYTTPQFREAMLLFNEMYREGLLTDASFTMDKSQLEQEVAAGRVFASTSKTNVSTARNSLYAQDNNAKMMYAGQFTGATNTKVMVPANNNMGWTASLINKNAKNADRIIRLFAYLNTQEACLDNEWGTGCWTLGSDGLVVRDPEMQKADEANPTEFTLKYKGDMGWTSDYTIIQGTYPSAPSAWSDDVYLQTHDDRIVIYDDKCFSDTAPGAGSDEAAIQARVMEYRTQALGKIVTAPSAAQCEKELDLALAEMENLGLSKLTTYQNELFQQNKAKLGLTFAYPGNR